jgi:hypothetical protein
MGILHAFGIGFGIVPHGTQKDNNVYLSQPHWSSSNLHSISKGLDFVSFQISSGVGGCVMGGGIGCLLSQSPHVHF